MAEDKKVSAISLSWSANFLQRKDQVSHYSEYSGIECKVNDTAEKLLKVGAADEIVAYTNPEWLSPEKIKKKFLPRVEKLAKAIGYEIVEQRFDPRYPLGHPNLNGHGNEDQGTMYYKLVKNPALKPEAPKPKSDEELRQIGFANAQDVKEGQQVEVRFTANNGFYRRIGEVVRVNPRSIRTKHPYEATHYFKANTINNGIFLIPEGRFDEIKASVDKFTEDTKKRDEILKEIMKDVTFTCEPAIRTHDKFGNEINSIDCFELAHPTTAESVKAKCQLEAASEQQKFSEARLVHHINQKLKEAGQEPL